MSYEFRSVCEERIATVTHPSPLLSVINMSIYYDFSKIDSYVCPVKIVLAQRGIGKTFAKVKKCIETYITKGTRFIYVVETGDMVNELTRNNGEKFWCNILEYYNQQDTSRKRYFHNKLTRIEVVSDGEDEVKQQAQNIKVIGGTIRINGGTAGYIIDMNSFADLKRNNFANVEYVIVDEFISEKLDKTVMLNPRKLSSIIQSIARLKNVKIYMFGNSVRPDDPILARMGFKLTRYGYYFKHDSEGLFAVLHFVDPADYPEFREASKKSVAGRFAAFMGETNEEENSFATDLPSNRRCLRFNFKKNGWFINIVRDDMIITLKEMADGNIACIPFTGRNTQNLYCLNEREQGFKLGYHIRWYKELRQTIQNMISANVIYYYSEIEYTKLKTIIKGV